MSLLRKLPKIDALLSSDEAAALIAAHGRDLVAHTLRNVVDSLREELKKSSNGADESALSTAAVLSRTRASLETNARPGLRRVLNATGIILHTGLGRAVLPKAALEALLAENSGYNLLEVSRETGDRAHRERHVSRLLEQVAGAPAATVVNNNAAATMIALAALAAGREVVVSRGQLVEIGGAFRMPDVMSQSGCRMVEVGTTNRTRIGDYEAAITERTAMLMRVHRSNFAIVGFTEEPSLEEMVALAKKKNLLVMDDVGSGTLVDVARYGIAAEPLIRDSLRAGADVACISGDKLLGGPQAGILVGTADAIAKVRRHPLFRAVRPDKLQLVALEATLRLYLNPDTVEENVPTLRMMKANVYEMEKRAKAIVKRLKDGGLDAEVWPEESQIGGGSTPGQNLPTRVVALTPPGSPDEFAKTLRLGDPPVFARVKKDRVLFDPRTLQPGEDEELAKVLRMVAQGK
jgi:L-seryl-tRNA(Ser) seleniumtransferase